MIPRKESLKYVAPEHTAAMRAYRRGERTPEARAANAAYHRSYRQTTIGKMVVRNMNLKRYGLTAESYSAMLKEQGGGCAACGQIETKRNQFGVVSLAVDHDHDTGEVRGILCMNCNRALGILDDSVRRLQQLLNYRKRH